MTRRKNPDRAAALRRARQLAEQYQRAYYEEVLAQDAPTQLALWLPEGVTVDEEPHT